MSLGFRSSRPSEAIMSSAVSGVCDDLKSSIILSLIVNSLDKLHQLKRLMLGQSLSLSVRLIG